MLAIETTFNKLRIGELFHVVDGRETWHSYQKTSVTEAIHQETKYTSTFSPNDKVLREL